MVHLASVSTDKQRDENGVPDLDGLDLGAPDDDFSTNVYGSRFAATDVPKHEMPEEEMPREVAYRLIK